MNPRLVVVAGPLEGRTFELRDDRVTIGRHSSCDLQIQRPEVSRRHSEIQRDGEGRYVLRDLESSHGTFVNGRPVAEKPLEHNDLVNIGQSTLLFLADESPEESAQPDPEPQLADGVTQVIRTVPHLDPAHLDASLPEAARLARELHALLRLSTALHGTLEVEALGERLLDAAFDSVPAEHGAVLLHEPGTDRPEVLLERGAGAVSRTAVTRVCDEGETHLTQRVGDLEASAAGAGALIAAPLVSSAGENLGVLYLDRRRAGFTERHVELATAIAGVASLAFQNAFLLRWQRSENARLRDENAEHHEMIGESVSMRRIFALVDRVARTDSTVLVFGESGTGKELVVRAIHRASPRRDAPFVAVNCASLSETLLESELFGHEKGAFTGAVARKVGKMEAAHRGTLFLDEVADIPAAVQAKLLRALQEREVERLGGARPIPVDVRLVAATHRDLEQAVQAGTFREDLYYRLKVITCDLPPLRDRRQDIPLLASHFVNSNAAKLGLTGVGIAPETRRCLLGYDWPGNVRELANVIERALVLGDREAVRPEDLPDEVAACVGEEAPSELQAALVAFKKKLIRDAFRLSGNDYARTAESLGIHVNSLHRMIRSLGLKEDLER